MQVQISAVIITYNEETNIKRCLDSLVSVADEIVVVDSYSTDRPRRFAVHTIQCSSNISSPDILSRRTGLFFRPAHHISSPLTPMRPCHTS